MAEADTPPIAGSDWQWMTGFECSTFPQVGMDELVLTQHERFWGGDIVRAAEAGCRVLRYGIRWHVVNPRPHVWDWSSVDGPFELMQSLGIEPVADLFHFGVPEWMGTGVLTSIFPDFQAELCQEFARRYPWVRWYTPTNEPYIMAQFGGEIGVWYPYEHGPQNFVRALRNVARGMCEGWREIRAERPDARMMISDTCEYWHALDEGVAAVAAERNERRFLMHELYGGRVGDEHPFREFLVGHGMEQGELWWFEENPAPLDVVGLDHYPHSEHQLRTGQRGELVDETCEMDRQLGPGELARQYFERLGRPVLFAETSAPGDDDRKRWWLDRIVGQVREARASGIPVIGLTWWGLIDQVDWGSALRRHRHEIDPTGLYRLEWRGQPRSPEAILERIPTGALESWRALTSRPAEGTVGPLADVSWPDEPAPLW